MNNLLTETDLEMFHIFPFIPICLCLDVSGSMNRIFDGNVTALQELKGGINLFCDNLFEDEVARYAAEICIVTFGGNAELVMDFATPDKHEAELKAKIDSLKAHGETPMGEAVNKALDCLEIREQEYKESGVDYRRPFLVLMTGSKPNGDATKFYLAVSRTFELAIKNELTIFPIGIGDKADMECLAKFSPNSPPLRLKDMDFRRLVGKISLNALMSTPFTRYSTLEELMKPEEFWKAYAKCKLCGKEFDEESLEQGICRNCLNEGEHYHCENCGREMIYTNYQKLIKHAKRYTICRDCYERKNTTWERRVCKDCGRIFEITLGQKEFFEKKSLHLPMRCENCRRKSNISNVDPMNSSLRPLCITNDIDDLFN